ncbi:MAG: phosphoenolpyruvate--protein phosphotransferase [Planctomycetota bacterium]|jgi:phosphotransferase system enzyme I (PtsI)|nr:phosphoenolpyruvate--protein phosphotransferase [Planctomycetales bacterium]RLT06411.1 MAG: phosphoenolpyruvate--protein phosphotransferase [Planctomycetota bacterium]
MKVYTGIAVSPGVVSGPVLVLGSDNFRIPRKYVNRDAIDDELHRFHAAHEHVCRDIKSNEQLVSAQLGAQYGAIFSAHLQMAQDPRLIREVEALIREQTRSPEFAVSRVLRSYAEQLEKMGDRYLSERALDIFDLEKRLLRQLLGESREELRNLTEPVIVLAHDLTPSETATLDTKFVLGFATEVGGRTSHTAILAGALEIPAIVGLGRCLAGVSGGETVILDGDNGRVIIDPDSEMVARVQDMQIRSEKIRTRLGLMEALPAETEDGQRVTICGNIEFPEEVRQCIKRGADGVGLYRTEFLFLSGNREPSESDHYEAYCRVVEACGDLPVVIRTLDIGADKVPKLLESQFSKSQNPMLGLRSIRLSLLNTPMFKRQLRAILRASVHGNVRVMFPLISTLLEFRQAKMILMDVMEDLEDEGIPFQRNIPIGMMVEVPSAVILAEEFAREVDFFSIGTNDLIQYTLACDRSDPAVSNLYRSGDPSILRLIQMVLRAAEKHGKPVTVCGQMSSDPRFIPLLLGMGLRSLSATPQAIPRLKEVVRNLSISEAVRISQHASSLDLARDVEHYLQGELSRLCPDLVDTVGF